MPWAGATKDLNKLMDEKKEVDPKEATAQQEQLEALAEQEAERKAKHVRKEQEREAERQKIRDKVGTRDGANLGKGLIRTNTNFYERFHADANLRHHTTSQCKLQTTVRNVHMIVYLYWQILRFRPRCRY